MHGHSSFLSAFQSRKRQKKFHFPIHLYDTECAGTLSTVAASFSQGTRSPFSFSMSLDCLPHDASPGHSDAPDSPKVMIC